LGTDRLSQPSHSDVLKSTPLLRELPDSLSIHRARDGSAVTYPDLTRRVASRLGALTARLPERPCRVVVGMSDPVETLSTLFAVWVAGHCAVLVNPDLAGEERRRVVAKVTPSLWADDDGLHDTGVARPDAPAWPDAALILMTSGTTGDPKGVVHSLETLETRLKLNLAEIGTEALARTLCPLPLFFGHGLIGNCLTPLYAGQDLYLLDAPGLPDFATFGALIDRYRITFLSSVPSMWRMILRVSERPKQAPTRVHVGSAPLTDELWSEIEAWCGTRAVFNTYGMTETANWISGGRRPETGADGYVGRPWGGHIRVVRDGVLHETGRGEVALASPSLMLGLWDAPVGAAMHDGHFLTGDNGELAADQTLRLVGRSKNEINRGGIKVLAEEIDMLLERHPDVVEACSFAIPDDIAGELVAAAVKPAPGAAPEPQALIAWCRDRVRHEAVPSRIAVVDEIAKTDRGKLARGLVQKEMLRRWS